jgi:hypothetical protein
VEQDTDETVGRSKSYREESEYRRRKNNNTEFNQQSSSLSTSAETEFTLTFLHFDLKWFRPLHALQVLPHAGHFSFLVSALDDSDDDCWLNAIDAVSEKYISVVEANVDKKVTALMKVNDCEVRFQLDSAADVNTICKKFVRKD